MNSLKILTVCAFLGTILFQQASGQCLTDFTKLVPEPAADYTAGFGSSVAMHGNYLAVGIPGSDSLGRLTGIVRIYEKLPTGWKKIAALAPSDAKDALAFGVRLRMSQNYLLVGAAGYNGKVYVFKKPASGWTSQTELTSFTIAGSAGFGSTYNDPIAISEDEQTLAITDPDYREAGQQDVGAIFVYHKQPADEWNNTITPTMIGPIEKDVDMLGRGGVAIDGDRIIAMTPFAPTANGAIYILRDPSGTFENFTVEARLTSGLLAESVLWMGNFALLPEGIVTYATINMNTQGKGALIFFEKPASGNWAHATRTCDFQLNEMGSSSGVLPVLSTTGEDIFLPTRDVNGYGTFTKISKGAAGWCSPLYETIHANLPPPAPVATRYGVVSTSNGSDKAVVGFVPPGMNEPPLALVALTNNESGEWIDEVIEDSNKSSSGHRYGVTLLVKDDLLFVGAPNDGTVKENAGAVYIYKKTAGSWTEVDKVRPTVRSAYDDVFGSAIAQYGEYLAIGAKGYGAQGKVFMYKKTNSDWSQPELVQEIELPDDFLNVATYGDNVAMNDEWLLIPYLRTNPSLMVTLALYKFNGTAWDFNQTVEVKDAIFLTKSYTASVSIEGNTILAGPSVLELGSDGIWRIVATMMPSDPEPMRIAPDFSHWVSNGALFGFTSKLTENTIFIGAPQKDFGSTWDVGAVYIYTKKPGDKWTSRTETTKIVPRVKDEGELFGYSLAVLDNTLIAGAPGTDFLTTNAARNKPGRAYVFQSRDYYWKQVDPLIDFTGDSFTKDYYGLTVAMDEANFIISAPIEDLETGALSGSVYITPTPPIVKLVPPVCNSHETIDLFGYPFGGTWAGPGLIDSQEGIFDPKVAGLGQHEFTYTTASCTYVGKLVIEVQSPVEAILNVNNLHYVCAEAANISVPLSVKTVSNQRYQWYHRSASADPFFPLNATAAQMVATQRGEYRVKVHNGICESFSDVVRVQNEKVPLSATPPDEVCQDDSQGVALQISPAGGTWQGPGINGNKFYSRDLADGEYKPSYRYVSPRGCKYDTSVAVMVKRLVKPTITRTGHLCVDGAVSLSVPAPSDSRVYLDWKHNDAATSDFHSLNVSDPMIQVTERGNYRLTVSNGKCTVQTDVISIADDFDAIVTPGENEFKLCSGNSVELSLEHHPARRYQWFYSEISDGYAQLLAETGNSLEAFRSGYYHAVVTSGVCEDQTGTQHVFIAPKDSVFIPNVITPAGDGKNDAFTIFSTTDDIVYIIYDRYGDIVFRGDEDTPWTAEHNSSGVYFWMARYRTCEGELKKVKGTVHVIKTTTDH